MVHRNVEGHIHGTFGQAAFHAGRGWFQFCGRSRRRQKESAANFGSGISRRRCGSPGRSGRSRRPRGTTRTSPSVGGIAQCGSGPTRSGACMKTISSWRRRSTASSKRGCCRHERSPADQPPAPRTARRGSENAPGSGSVRCCHHPPRRISPFPLDASSRTLMALPGGTLREPPFSPRNRWLSARGLQSVQTLSDSSS